MAFMDHVNEAAKTAATSMPKSYLPEQRRQALFREGGMRYVYQAESDAAGDAGDEDAAWEWLRFVELSPLTLRGIKMRAGGQFIRDMKLNTTKADQAYGPGWLDR